MKRLLLATLLLPALCVLTSYSAFAEEPPGEPHLSQFAAGKGPELVKGAIVLLDSEKTPDQLNAAAFDRSAEGARAALTLRCKLTVEKGGDGGSILFLNTAKHGARGPAPFLKSAVEPNLDGTFAVGIDVHNPPSKEQFSPWGNYRDLPQREISLHWDGREIVKRVAPKEFRGEAADVLISLAYVSGGAEVTVEIAGGKVYDREFVAGLMPYEMRLGFVAGTRPKVSTKFMVYDLDLELGEPAAPQRPPLHVEVFNHVLTNNKKTAYETEVELPPVNWAFGRVLLTLDIHDAGTDWDEWDRNGDVSIWDDEGNKHVIVPFITSYRTPCHWVVDVTHFRPWLSGKTKIEVRAGTTFYKNRGYMMSVSLDFHHGTPDHVAHRVVPLWEGTAKYKSAENHFKDFFEPRTVAIEEDIVAARIFTTTTGHSQIGEFTPSARAIVVDPDKAAGDDEEPRFENVLWKTDVYLNPNRPQFGTWQYSRAGWAPGDIVRPWWIDLTTHLRPGTEAGFRYEPTPYDFAGASRQPPQKQIDQASHVVRSYLILYRQPGTLVHAPILLVTNVADGSNAATAGIKRGDYLARYGDRQLNTVDDLRAAIGATAKAGAGKVTVVVFRGPQRLELQLDPGKMGVNLAAR